MEFIHNNLLTLITFLPLLGAGIILLLPQGNKGLVRWTALFFSLLPLALAIQMWLWYQAAPCTDITAGACFEQQAQWFPLLNSTFHIGVDGISLTMVMLTTLLTPLAILMSWSIEERVNLYMALFLMLEMGMLGVFVSLDLLIFFVFWEIGLVPMYFLINIWGSANRQCQLQVLHLHDGRVAGFAAEYPDHGSHDGNLRHPAVDGRVAPVYRGGWNVRRDRH